MCLSGYMFQSPTFILPYLEPPRIGPTSLLARSIAKRLKCCVVAGYPEALPSAAMAEDIDTDVDFTVDISRLGSSTRRSEASSTADRLASLRIGEASTSNSTFNADPRGTGQEGSRAMTPLGETRDQVMPNSMKALDGEALGVGYNSAVVVNPSGEVVGNYRKTFRFETDKNWAREGMYLESHLMVSCYRK